MIWWRRPSTPSAAPRKPAASATEKFLFQQSRKPSGSGLGNPGRTPFEARFATGAAGGKLQSITVTHKKTRGYPCHDHAEECDEADKGQRRQICRLSVYRSARQVAARHLRRFAHRGRDLRRRPDVRRFFDGRLEGDP